ncbi:MAG: hypothetical protein NW226_16115 [Microscillaceae bacterium]|nr:hypothetical protein [Microscillaceae bacterium]
MRKVGQNKDKEEEKFSYHLYDPQGFCIDERQVKGKKKELIIHTLQAGFYQLVIEYKGKQKTWQVLIE